MEDIKTKKPFWKSPYMLVVPALLFYLLFWAYPVFTAVREVFTGVDEQIHRTTSGADLIDRLNETTPWLMCSLVHKFGRKEEADYEGYVE